MDFNLTATNAKLEEPTSPNTIRIWARDASGNECRLELNDRLTRRVLDSLVNKRIDAILADLQPIMGELRIETDSAEATLRDAHNNLFARLRSEIGLRRPRVEQTVELTA